MPTYVDGGACVIKRGTFASPTEIVGHGNMSLTMDGDTVKVSNKSVGGWVITLDGASTEKSMTASVTFSQSDDTSFQTLADEAFNFTRGAFVIQMGNSHYYEGEWTPKLTGETGDKGAASDATIVFESSGTITRTLITP